MTEMAGGCNFGARCILSRQAIPRKGIVSLQSLPASLRSPKWSSRRIVPKWHPPRDAKLPCHSPISRFGPSLSWFAFELAKACFRLNWRKKELGRF